MLYIQYIRFVEERAGLRTESEAEKAISSVFEVLDKLLPIERAYELAQTLPLEIREYIGKKVWRVRFDLHSFVAGIADREGVDPATAGNHARAVLSVLAEYLPSVELLDALDEMPKEIRRLFIWEKRAA